MAHVYGYLVGLLVCHFQGRGSGTGIHLRFQYAQCSRAEAAERIEAWRLEYNASRPPRALGERTPHEFLRQIAASRNLHRLANAGD
jgi:hypothetical protein